MRYIGQHIRAIIEKYDGALPLAHFLKNYFKQYPILGSRDRRLLGAMAYSWYRCHKGISGMKLEFEEQVQMCMKLCGHDQMLPPAMSAAELPEPVFDLDALFPFSTVLSAGANKQTWLQSMLAQPNLFIRVRKDIGKVTSLLNGAQIPFTFITDNCLSLPNGAKIDTLLPPDTYAVQDASSQRTGNYFLPKKKELWYDCCSGAGGKSLLLKDIEPGVRLTVSDSRESIIHNLKDRFKLYRMEMPVAHVTDVANGAMLGKALGGKQFDNIICDAPCSGSGTWARTPEQLYFFNPAVVEKFAALQKTIATNVAAHLKEGGRLIYITCSVFKEENEAVVAEVTKAPGLRLLQSELIDGTGIQADSMFVAQFENALNLR